MSRKSCYRWFIAAACGLAMAGCGEGEMENGIVKSPYAPTQAQLDDLNKQVLGQYKSMGRHSPKHSRRAGHHG